MNKEKFLSTCERARKGFLTSLQWGLSMLIAPALILVIAILWIEDIKD